jgi:hypothetical protein
MREPQSLDRGANAEVLGRTVRLRDDLVLRSLVSETVLMDLDTGECYRLDPAGGRMLEALVTSPSLGAAAGTLSEQGFGDRDEVATDLVALREMLAEMGFLAPEIGEGR